MFINGNNSGNSLYSLVGKRESALDKTVGDDVVGGGDSFSFGEAAGFTAGGAALGAGIGALAGYASASGKVNNVPVQSVTETWKVPVTTDKTIGSIPHEQYFPASHIGSILGTTGGVWDSIDRPNVNPDLRATEPVVRQTPTLAPSGDPVFQDVTKTFSGHGQPIVHTDSHIVTIPSLQGFSQNVQDDAHYETRDDGTRDQNGNENTTQVRVLDGVRVQFSPNVKDTPVNSANNHYDTKDVTFNSGVDVGGIVLKGALIGAGIGAAVGLAADVAKQTLSSRHGG